MPNMARLPPLKPDEKSITAPCSRARSSHHGSISMIKKRPPEFWQCTECISGRRQRARLLDNLSPAAFADARPAVVARGRVVEVGHAASGFVNQPPDARHLLEVDLLDAVGVVVIVGMKSRREEDNGNALGGIAVMIAAVVDLLKIGRIVNFEIELERLGQAVVGLIRDVVQLGADAVGADQVDVVRFFGLVVAIAPDHIHIEVGDDLINRRRRVIGVKARPPQPALFAREPEEHQRALRLRPRSEGLRDAQQSCRSRPVVVGAVPDSVFDCALFDASDRPLALALPNLAPGVADVVVMRAEGHVSVFELRIASLDYADDVARELRANDLVIGVEVECELDAFERERRQRLLLRGFLFQLGVFDLGVAEEEFKEIILSGDIRRQGMVQPLHGGEFLRLDASAGAGPGGPGASSALPSAESASANADARDGLSLIGGVSSATAERAAELRPQPLRPIGAEVDDRLALHVLARVIIVIGERRVEAITEEFDLIHGEAAFASQVSGKSAALAVFERPRLAVYFNRERRTIRALLNAEHAHALKV